MALHIPTLAALRAFQSAARHLSFTNAADELCITQSAVSHQIRSLEEQIGAPLFLRGPKSIALTARGKQYLNQVAPLLDQLAEATLEVRGESVQSDLNILVPPVFATRWLLPRLNRFKNDWPEINLNILSYDRCEAESQTWDMRINCGYQMPPSDTEEAFLFTTQTPVCSPELLAESPRIDSPDDLDRFTILRDKERDGWDEWFRLSGHEMPADLDELWVDNGYLLTAAVLSGQGVALGYSILIEDALDCGQLVRLFDTDTEPVLAYTVTYSKLTGRSRKVAALREWFSKETEALPGNFNVTEISPAQLNG